MIALTTLVALSGMGSSLVANPDSQLPESSVSRMALDGIVAGKYVPLRWLPDAPVKVYDDFRRSWHWTTRFELYRIHGLAVLADFREQPSLLGDSQDVIIYNILRRVAMDESLGLDITVIYGGQFCVIALSDLGIQPPAYSESLDTDPPCVTNGCRPTTSISPGFTCTVMFQELSTAQQGVCICDVPHVGEPPVCKPQSTQEKCKAHFRATVIGVPDGDCVCDFFTKKKCNMTGAPADLEIDFNSDEIACGGAGVPHFINVHANAECLGDTWCHFSFDTKCGRCNNDCP